MVKKCIYCKTQVDDESVVDVCRRCGIGVWGEKMFNAILENMGKARDAGDLHQGSVSQTLSSSKPKVNPAISNIARDAIATKESQKSEADAWEIQRNQMLSGRRE